MNNIDLDILPTLCARINSTIEYRSAKYTACNSDMGLV